MDYVLIAGELFDSAWAAGVELINLTHSWILSWTALHDQFEMTFEQGNYGQAFAVKFLVFNKKKCPEFRAKRLPAYWWQE